MLHAYRLVSPDDPPAPDPRWEWRQPSIGHLLWNARTFGRQVVQRSFATWDALDRKNTRLWETAYAPRVTYKPWPTWCAWLAEYRELLVNTREVYGAHHGQGAQPCPP
jgi:hypothetical protein